MKVGDLVELDFHVTRRGLGEEDQVGLVVEIFEIANVGSQAGNPVAVVDFCGVLRKYPVGYLRVVSESR